MNKLWKYIYPCDSDIYGFISVINKLNCLGIINDSGEYKIRAEKRNDVCSCIKEEHIVNGCENKVRSVIDANIKKTIDFCMLVSAPCSNLINPDLNRIKEEVEEKYQVPASVVKISGEKDYVYGISNTLYEMGRLLLKEKGETIPNSVNMIGCNDYDFSVNDVKDVVTELNGKGLQVLSVWGVEEKTENLIKATQAEYNLVVNISGLKLAKYMEKQFGIPYQIHLPVTKNRTEKVLQLIEREITGDEKGEAEILIIDEQYKANAIREILVKAGYRNIKVCSFFEVDKKSLQEADAKLKYEDELIKMIENSNIKVVFANDNFTMLFDKYGIRRVDASFKEKNEQGRERRGDRGRGRDRERDKRVRRK